MLTGKFLQRLASLLLCNLHFDFASCNLLFRPAKLRKSLKLEQGGDRFPLFKPADHLCE